MSILLGLSHDDICNLINQIPWHHEFEFGKVWPQQKTMTVTMP
jgi:hypothetical protein